MASGKVIRGSSRKEAQSVGDVMKVFLRQMKLGSRLNTRRVFAAWDAVSGASAFTLRRFYRDGKLYVTLSSSMVRNQLEFQKTALVAAINTFLENDGLFMKDDGRVGFVKELILK